MRPLVSPSIALAAALLSGAAVTAGPAPRSPERVAPAASVPQEASSFQLPGVVQRSSSAVDPESRLPLHEFFFTRAIYSGTRRGWRGGGSWAIDYPKADRQFMVVVNRLANVDGSPVENAVRLDDPELRRYPFLYALEVGSMRLTPPEVQGLRSYLHAGGFLVVDDFWGTWEWANFEREISRVLPGRELVELTVDHPLFRAFYDIEEIRQVPGFGRGVRGGPTWERDGVEPRVWGIHDDDGRLMVVVHHNTDLGDAWEHAESPYYPLEYSTYAYEVGVNMIVYAMSH